MPDTPDLPPDEVPQQPDGNTGAPGAEDGSGSPWFAIAAALLALVGLAGVVAARRSRSHQALAGRAAALDAQRRVLHTAARLGVPRHRSETTSEAMHRWASEGRCDPTAAAELAGIAQRAAFAPAAVEVDGARVTQLADRCAQQLRESADTTARVLEPVRLPATWLTTRARGALAAARERLQV